MRDIKSLPIGSKPTTLRMKVQRLKCRDCGCDQQERIHFTTGKRHYTHRLARFVIGLLTIMTIKAAAEYLGLTWDTVKDIHKHYLKMHYSKIDISGVKRIGIDEFAVRKGHVYKTIVVDLDTGQIIYVGDGKGADALDGFWKQVEKWKPQIECVATDLSAAFISSVMKNLPEAKHVFDHFHVQKLAAEAVDEVRRVVYNQEKDELKRKIIKGNRWLLLYHGEDIFDKYEQRLQNVLNLNTPITKAYYLKEYLRQVWMQPNKWYAGRVLDDWVSQARQSKVPQLIKLSNTLMAYRTGILAWYDYHISTGKVEGTNNKIKVLKRTAYGYRDDDYFVLKLFALHDAKITSFVG